MANSEIGLIGLGVMGQNLALNIADHDIPLSVYNRSEGSELNIVKDFISDYKGESSIKGYTELQGFVTSLQTPRKILLMIKAGEAIDSVIEALLPVLSKDDIVIDGGNSYYKDTHRRQDYLASKGIHLIGCGISGGAKGARFGPSLMPGGHPNAFKRVSGILSIIAAKDLKGNPCCAYISKDGAGHYVKMIHNGIEYAEMQLIAELFSTLKLWMDNEAIADLFEAWNNTELKSFLLEITISILRTKVDNDYLVDLILDKSGSKGTGSWSVKAALEMGFPANMISSALFARYFSSFKNRRTKLSKSLDPSSNKNNIDISILKNAYTFARIINHEQGFAILSRASLDHSWNLNLAEIARIWTNGCIIRSKLMEQLSDKLINGVDGLLPEVYFNDLKSQEFDIRTLLKFSLDRRITLDCFQSAYNYWISMTTESLPANIIQAQRDYFGGHGFERIDQPNKGQINYNWDCE